MIKIFIVDDQHIIREGTKTLLSQASKIKIIGEAEDGESALQKIGILQPDVVLLDINLPGIDGFDVAEKINYKFPQIQTIILSSNEQESYVKKAISLGVRGYLSKNVSSEELEWTIELVYKGYSVIKPELSRQRSQAVSHSKSASTILGDRSVNRQASESVQISQDFSPKQNQEETKTNSDGIEDLLAKKRIQQRYAKYKRRRPKNRLFYNANLAKLKKTVASWEFGLLFLIILFSLSFLTMVALSK